MAYDLLSGKKSSRDWSCGAEGGGEGFSIGKKAVLGVLAAGALAGVGWWAWTGPLNRGYKVHRSATPRMYMSRSPSGRIMMTKSPLGFYGR